MNPKLPKPSAVLTDRAGMVMPEWRRFFESLVAQQTATAIEETAAAQAARLAELQDEIAAIPAPTPTPPPAPPVVVDPGTVSGGTVPIQPTNPGFESDLTSWAVGSAPVVISSTWAVITDAAQAHSGDKFLRWTGDSNPDPVGGPLETLTYFNTTNVDTMRDDLLDVNVWVRCKRLTTDEAGVTRARVGIQKYASDGTPLGLTIAGAAGLYGSSLDSGWVQISTFTEKSAGVAYFRAYVEAQGPDGSTVEFDDMSWNGTEYTP